MSDHNCGHDHHCHHHHHYYDGDCGGGGWSEGDSTILAWILLVLGIICIISKFAA